MGFHAAILGEWTDGLSSGPSMAGTAVKGTGFGDIYRSGMFELVQDSEIRADKSKDR
jgi:hypothetical protein